LTLGELVKEAERRLRAARLFYGHGTDNPRDEAAFLVLRGLDLGFDVSLDRTVPAAGRQRVEALLRKRIAQRVPAAYLLKEAWLEGRSFYVDRRAIIPRSHIGGLLTRKLRPWLPSAPRRILDLCTGSGCLAILAALAFPRADVHGADLSEDALAVARINVGRYRLQRRVRLVRSDLFDGLDAERYDLIVTNPPYVPMRAMRALPAEYRYEPGMALAGGGDGLSLVSRILERAPDFLSPRGMLVCEIGDNRRAAQRAYSDLPLLWPQDEVFIWEPSRKDARPRKRSRRAAAA
jgi:ribosomal protein L3 glutamine methyltransferase